MSLTVAAPLTTQQRSLQSRATLLFFLGVLTGLWAGVVLSRGRAIGLHFTTVPAHERLALAAHLNGLFGCFWLLAIAWTLPQVRLAERNRLRLTRLATLATFSNWAVTLVASVLDVRGLAFVGEARNDLIAALLSALVVLPTLLAAALWAWGLRPAPPTAAA